MALEHSSEVQLFLVPQHEDIPQQPREVIVGGKSMARIFGVVVCLGCAAVVAFQFGIGIQNSELHPLVISPSETENKFKGEITNSIASSKTSLARSWRLDASQPFLVAPSQIIFEEASGSVVQIALPSVFVDIITSDSSKKFAAEITSKLGLSGSYGALTGAAETSLSAMTSSRTKKFRLDKVIRAHHTQISMVELQPYKILTEEAKHFLLKKSVDQIHATLGDFYATQVGLGGVFQVTVIMTMTQDDSEVSLGTQVQAELDSVVASAKATMAGGASTSTKIGQHQARTKLTVLGGDSNLWLEMTKDNQDQVQKKWAKSFTMENEYPTEFRLVPLWELLDNDKMNRTKAQELRSFMLNLWKQEESKIPQHDAAPSGVAPSNACLHVTGASVKELNGYYGINPKNSKYKNHWRYQKMWNNGSFIVHNLGKTFQSRQGELKMGLYHGSENWKFWWKGWSFPYVCGQGKKPDKCQVVDKNGIPPVPHLEWLKDV